MSDTEQYSEEHLLTLLKDPSKEREHIGVVAKWILNFPESADSIVKVWKEYLTNAKPGDQLRAMYIAHEIGQRWERKKCASKCESLITAFSKVIAEAMGVVYNGEHTNDNKKQKLLKLVDVWEKQGIFSDSVAATRTAIGPVALLGHKSPPAPDTNRLIVSRPGTPSRPTADEATNVSESLSKLLPTPESDTWADLTGFPSSLVYLVHTQTKILELQRQIQLSAERMPDPKYRLDIDQRRIAAIDTADKVTLKGWELDRDETVAHDYEDSLRSMMERYELFASDLKRLQQDHDTRRKEIDATMQRLRHAISRVPETKKRLAHRFNVLTGVITDSNAMDTTASTSGDHKNGTNAASRSSGDQRAKSSDHHSNQSSRSNDGRKGNREHSRDGRDDRDSRDGSRQRDSRGHGREGSRDGRGSYDSRDSRGDARRDFRESSGRDRRDERGNYHGESESRRDDFKHSGSQRGDDDRDARDGGRRDYDRRGSDDRFSSSSRDGPRGPDRGGRNDSRDRGNDHGGRNSGRDRNDDQGKRNTPKRGSAAADAQRSTTNTSSSPASKGNNSNNSNTAMQVDEKHDQKSTTSPATQTPTTTPATKRRNREDAGMPASADTAANVKKPKLAEEVTEFVDEF